MLQYSFWILGIEAYYFSWFDSFWFLNLWEGVRITTLTVPEKRFFMLSFRNLILVQKKLRYKIQIMGGGGGGGGYCWQLSQIWYFSQIWHFYQNWHFSQIWYFSKNWHFCQNWLLYQILPISQIIYWHNYHFQIWHFYQKVLIFWSNI